MKISVDSVRQFLESPVVKKLRKEGNLEEIANTAISVGTINGDEKLRRFGSHILYSDGGVDKL